MENKWKYACFSLFLFTFINWPESRNIFNKILSFTFLKLRKFQKTFSTYKTLKIFKIFLIFCLVISEFTLKISDFFFVEIFEAQK